MILLVTFDLHDATRNYEEVWRYLRSYVHCRANYAVWLVESPRVSPADMHSDLRIWLDPRDLMLIGRLSRDWAAAGSQMEQWLNDPARSW